MIELPLDFKCIMNHEDRVKKESRRESRVQQPQQRRAASKRRGRTIIADATPAECVEPTGTTAILCEVHNS